MVWQELTQKPPSRRECDVGTIGRKIQLQANFFQVEIHNPNKVIFHYDVVFKKDVKDKHVVVKLSSDMRKIVFEEMRKQYKYMNIGFDGRKNAVGFASVSPEDEMKGANIFQVDFSTGDKTKVYYVYLDVVNKKSLKDFCMALIAQPKRRVVDSTMMQMLEILFHHSPMTIYEKVGRNSFFSMGGEFGPSQNLGGRKEAMVGFFESLRPMGWKKDTLLLNIDLTNAAFYKEQSVIDFMKDCLNDTERGLKDTKMDLNRPLDEPTRQRLKKWLKNMKVQVTHTHHPRKYTVCDITSCGADELKFMCDTGQGQVRQISVKTYFKNRYDMELVYPRLNCLQVHPAEKNVYLPIEVCKIVKGQKVKKKLSDNEMAQFMSTTAKLPYQRLDSIQNTVKKLNFRNEPLVKGLEFSVSEQPLRLDGRVLPAPKLLMNEEIEPNKGVWDPRSHTFFLAANMENWAVLNYDSKFIKDDKLKEFLDLLMKMGRERGMCIREPQLIEAFLKPVPETNLPKLKKEIPNLQLIIVVLPKVGDCYNRVKKVGDMEVNIMTQCVKGENVRKCHPVTVSNILLKINVKLGGINIVLGPNSRPMVFRTPVMIMGADVNHPPAGDTGTPSLAAVVASMDFYASKYETEVRSQYHRTEMIQDLKEMTKNLLISFYRTTNEMPGRIIMYRDGVSESQFVKVLSFELNAMREACKELEANYEPGMTFIVVQKRHHARFFCSERDGVGKSNNIPPGTIVDTMVTHPTEIDFYLCSHQGIQGTSRPSHYCVLWDDNDLTMDQLQTLTYAMCHLFSRCPRSVSIPTPAYYAHLVAFRAKKHLCPSETSSVSSGEIDDVLVSNAVKIDRQHGIASKPYFI